MMKSRLVVVIPYREFGLNRATLAACNRQSDHVFPILTTASCPFSYADLWRVLWRWPSELAVCEQDVVPRPGTIANFEECREPWCQHRHWLGDHWAVDTVALCRFSLDLRLRHPNLMDELMTKPDPRYWVRRGWTYMDPRCSVATLNGQGRKASLRPGAPSEATSDDPQLRPSTHDWMGIDTDLARALRGLGYEAHIHEPPGLHLHDYSKRPASLVRAWFDQPVEEQDWPEPNL